MNFHCNPSPQVLPNNSLALTLQCPSKISKTPDLFIELLDVATPLLISKDCRASQTAHHHTIVPYPVPTASVPQVTSPNTEMEELSQTQISPFIVLAKKIPEIFVCREGCTRVTRLD